jgi:ABC-2 type transport system permease protein
MLEELGKLPAFLRRDFLIAWSYRVGFVLDMVNILAQAVLFYFVSLLVDPRRIPSVGGVPTSYIAFVAVGIAVGSLLNLGMGRMMSAIRGEQLMGTLESLLATPTSGTTIQVGLVLYDLIYLPLRTGVLLALMAMVFDVDFRLSGVGPSLAIVAALVPFVWGLGAASAAAVMVFRQASGLVGIGGYVLGLLSGAYFPLTLLPPGAEALARLNPIALALNGLREALLAGTGWEPALARIAVLLPVAAVTWLAGTTAFRLAQAHERRAGTLGLY